MSAKNRLLEGFLFSDDASYEKAKKDSEIIKYLKNKVNMSDPAQVLRLYQQAIEQDLFNTIIGYEFLKKLQDYLLSLDDINDAEVLPIPQKLTSKDTTGEYDNALLRKENVKLTEKNKKLSGAVKKYKGKYNVTLTVTIILIVTVCVMFFISLSSNLPTIVNYRTKITDEYSSWQDELDEKEKELDKREQELNKKEVNQNADKEDTGSR
jgi:hypothetical protein